MANKPDRRRTLIYQEHILKRRRWRRPTLPIRSVWGSQSHIVITVDQCIREGNRQWQQLADEEEDVMPVVRSVKVWETDTLEVIWQGPNETEFRQYFTIPPKATREARNASGQVVDRTEENAAGQKL